MIRYENTILNTTSNLRIKTLGHKKEDYATVGIADSGVAKMFFLLWGFPISRYQLD